MPSEGDIEEIGATLPEFGLLEYPEKTVAYYIQCSKHMSILTNPKRRDEKIWAKEWMEEFKYAKKAPDSRREKETDLNEKAASLFVPETIDLTRSETQSTRTTDPDAYSDSLKIGRNVFLGN